MVDVVYTTVSWSDGFNLKLELIDVIIIILSYYVAMTDYAWKINSYI